MLSRIGASPQRNERLDIKLSFIFEELIRFGANMSPTIIILLAIWLGLNVAFVTMRIYLTADRRPRDGRDAAKYPGSSPGRRGSAVVKSLARPLA
jgi:hypothetical protein